ncbi:cadherin-like beta sandwich domain-containing protein [Candidatus Poriferisodalis sp.]|uniref:cadherin-like beta sandwich domain-containing protein n=1 Tax=Candidatus Poriferisodalis sp. TaxID=3101277 RepID=UPI003B52D0F0
MAVIVRCVGGGRRGWRRVGVCGAVVGVLASVLVAVPSVGVGAAGVPGVPSGLSAAPVEGGVLLSWDAPESDATVSGYRVLRRRPERGERTLSVLVSDTGTSETSYVDASAAIEGELFVYRVVALSDAVAGKRSARARVRYATPEPVVRAVETEPESGSGGVVWSGVLGVGTDRSVAPAMSGFSTWSRLGSLAPRSFEIDGVSSRVLVLLEHPGGVFFATDQAMGTDFVLDIGGREFVGSDSLVPALSVRGAYWWPSTSSPWSDGDSVDVEVRVPADAAEMGVREAAPLWAYFHRVPDTHDGTGAFEARLRFGEDVDTTAAALRDGVLAVSGGTVTTVNAVSAGSTRDWTVTVQPDGDGDVTLGVAGALGCSDSAAVCTTDGRTLPADIAVSVAGPAALVELAALSVDGAVLAPLFLPEITLYSAQVDAGVSQVTVEVLARDAAASVDISPADADTNVAGHQVTVAAGTQTTMTVTVRSADGSADRTYWIAFSPAAVATPAPPQLSDLTLDSIVPVPFASEQTRYETQAMPSTTETTVAVTAEEPGSTVEIFTVRSDDPALAALSADADGGTAGHQAQLSSTGDTLILVVVTSADGQRKQVYVVLVAAAGTAGGSSLQRAFERGGRFAVARADTPLPTLTSLTLTGATLGATFAAATTDYTASATAATTQITVTGVASANAGVIIVPADADPDTAGHQVALVEPLAGGTATQTAAAVIVRSTDGTRLNAYLISVSRAAPTGEDATLSALTLSGVTLSPAFAAGTYAYSVTVASTVSRTTVSATVSDADAAAVITPADADTNTTGHQVALSSGTNTVTVTVTASDDTTTRTYTVDVSRGVSNDADLSALSVGGVTLSPAFAAGTYAYTGVVAAAATEVTIAATAAHDGATVVVTPAEQPANAGSSGHQVTLEAAATRILVAVTAEDGATTRTYVVTLGRPATNEDATLSDLEIVDIRLGPVFVDSIYSYEAKVAHDTARVTVWAAPANVAAEVNVIPADADPDTAGHQVDLSPVDTGGAPSQTVVGVVVTSVDGTAAQTYAVEITRQAPILDDDGYLETELPEGCGLEPLFDTSDGKQPQSQWTRACKSMLLYQRYSGYSQANPPLFYRGHARFYRFRALSDGDVTIRMTDYDTSHHFVLRAADGTELQHVFYHVNFPNKPWCADNYGIACSPDPVLEATLEEGDYFLELVQHYGNRQRYFEFQVSGDVLQVARPRLASIAVDGTALAGFDPEDFRYQMARPGAEVTVSATPAATTPAHNVTVSAADADPDTAGHQVKLNEFGLTDVWFTVVESNQIAAKSYRVRFFGDAPPGTPLTAQFVDPPAAHRGYDTRFTVKIQFSEAIRMSFKWLRDSALEVTDGQVTTAKRVDGRADLWIIGINTDSRRPVTISLPASTSCVPESGLCSFFGKRLSNSIEVTVAGPDG